MADDDDTFNTAWIAAIVVPIVVVVGGSLIALACVLHRYNKALGNETRRRRRKHHHHHYHHNNGRNGGGGGYARAYPTGEMARGDYYSPPRRHHHRASLELMENPNDLVRKQQLKRQRQREQRRIQQQQQREEFYYNHHHHHHHHHPTATTKKHGNNHHELINVETRSRTPLSVASLEYNPLPANVVVWKSTDPNHHQHHHREPQYSENGAPKIEELVPTPEEDTHPHRRTKKSAEEDRRTPAAETTTESKGRVARSASKGKEKDVTTRIRDKIRDVASGSFSGGNKNTDIPHKENLTHHGNVKSEKGKETLRSDDDKASQQKTEQDKVKEKGEKRDVVSDIIDPSSSTKPFGQKQKEIAKDQERYEDFEDRLTEETSTDFHSFKDIELRPGDYQLEESQRLSSIEKLETFPTSPLQIYPDKNRGSNRMSLGTLNGSRLVTMIKEEEQEEANSDDSNPTSVPTLPRPPPRISMQLNGSSPLLPEEFLFEKEQGGGGDTASRTSRSKKTRSRRFSRSSIRSTISKISGKSRLSERSTSSSLRLRQKIKDQQEKERRKRRKEEDADKDGENGEGSENEGDEERLRKQEEQELVEEELERQRDLEREAEIIQSKYLLRKDFHAPLHKSIRKRGSSLTFASDTSGGSGSKLNIPVVPKAAKQLALDKPLPTRPRDSNNSSPMIGTAVGPIPHTPPLSPGVFKGPGSQKSTPPESKPRQASTSSTQPPLTPSKSPRRNLHHDGNGMPPLRIRNKRSNQSTPTVNETPTSLHTARSSLTPLNRASVNNSPSSTKSQPIATPPKFPPPLSLPKSRSAPAEQQSFPESSDLALYPENAFEDEGVLPIDQNTVYCVLLSYQPEKDDELELRYGDKLKIQLLFDDGWCLAEILNDSSDPKRNTVGMCPLPCLVEYEFGDNQS
ncbi:hypothetical protein TRICI_005563 [Trichomonascus ciferrii]|uniref:SH3 domain-containing protein n=1 Tax=Trichomonascus ciferrii TaxID=44093 RepID=A0A642US46_9ASCO|nr:hypothetical protein TRICI_005563 [Trichomonascus ciferrii]